MTAFIYCHFRSDNFDPFYVGIGRKKSRAYDRRGRNKWHKHVVSAHGLEVNVFGELPDWEAAQWWEKRWIKALKDAGYNLVNQTPGGDGGPTWTGRKHTDATKAKMSLASRGHKRNLGRVFSEEHRERLSLSQIGNKKALGRKDSDETRAKKSIAMKGKKHSLGRKRSAEELKKSSEVMIMVHKRKTPEERSAIIKKGHEKRRLNKFLPQQYWGA